MPSAPLRTGGAGGVIFRPLPLPLMKVPRPTWPWIKPFRFEFGVGVGDRSAVNAEHGGKLAAGGNAVAGAKIACVNERAQLIAQLDV